MQSGNSMGPSWEIAVFVLTRSEKEPGKRNPTCAKTPLCFLSMFFTPMWMLDGHPLIPRGHVSKETHHDEPLPALLICDRPGKQENNGGNV